MLLRLHDYYHELAFVKQDLFKFIAEQHEHNKVFILLMGLPGAGKSTLARQLYRRFSLRTISYDNTLRFIGKRNGLNFEEASKVYYKQAFMTVTNQLKVAMANGESVVYDSTGMYLSRRLNRLSFVPDDYVTIGIYLPIELQTALDRVKRRFDQAPSESYFDADYITNMHNKQQVPTADEFDYFFEIRS